MNFRSIHETAQMPTERKMLLTIFRDDASMYKKLCAAQALRIHSLEAKLSNPNALELEAELRLLDKTRQQLIEDAQKLSNEHQTLLNEQRMVRDALQKDNNLDQVRRELLELKQQDPVSTELQPLELKRNSKKPGDLDYSQRMFEQEKKQYELSEAFNRKHMFASNRIPEEEMKRKAESYKGWEQKLLPLQIQWKEVTDEFARDKQQLEQRFEADPVYQNWKAEIARKESLLKDSEAEIQRVADQQKIEADQNHQRCLDQCNSLNEMKNSLEKVIRKKLTEFREKTLSDWRSYEHNQNPGQRPEALR